VGYVPPNLGEFFDSTVTVAFNMNERRHVAAVEASDDKIEKFSTVLFKALVNGTAMTVKHPARVGGRVTGEEFYPAKLFLEPHSVAFRGSENRFSVDLSMVTNCDRMRREIAGATRDVLLVRHVVEGRALTSLAATDSSRKMGILGRYLRTEYSDLVADLKDVELSEAETELLVTIYSTGPDVSLANVLDVEPSQVEMLLSDLEQKELLVRTEETTEITGNGRIMVSNNIELLNS